MQFFWWWVGNVLTHNPFAYQDVQLYFMRRHSGSRDWNHEKSANIWKVVVVSIWPGPKQILKLVKLKLKMGRSTMYKRNRRGHATHSWLVYPKHHVSNVRWRCVKATFVEQVLKFDTIWGTVVCKSRKHRFAPSPGTDWHSESREQTLA